jgi:hypothetical protein
MSRRRTRPPPKRKSQSHDSEAPQPTLAVTVIPPSIDAAEDAGPPTRTGDELAALDAAWDE